jgi:hypothetical protein
MNINKKHVVYIFALLAFVTFLFSANYIFNILIKTGKEARLADISLPAETKNIKFNIDEIKREKLRWKEVVMIRGWVIKQENNYAERDVYLVLKSDKNTLVFKIKNEDIISRPDVSEYFHLAGGVHSHGFEIFIPAYRLKDDPYKIGFVIEDKSGKYYSVSGRTLKRSGETFVIRDQGPGQGSLSQPVSLILKKPGKEISYCFDIVSNSGNYIDVRGWGFLKGMDAGSLKPYILFRKDENVTVYNTGIMIRKDVTKAFSKYRLNLDSSGFRALIPEKDLEKGRYRLGLYITKGDQAGMVYSDKYIDIGK